MEQVLRGARLGRAVLVAAMACACSAGMARASGRDVTIDPCTIPDLGPGPVYGWTQTNHWGAYYVILTDLSARPPRQLNVVDGIAGYKAGQTILIGVDIRDRQGAEPNYPVAVHISIRGGRQGYVRRPGKTYRCRGMTFFWTPAGQPSSAPFPLDKFVYSLGSEAQVAGMIPAPGSSGRLEPLWAITEHLEIVFGETEAARDQQHHDGKADYAVRTEDATEDLKPPNPFQVAGAADKGMFFGPNLQPGEIPTIVQPFREYFAIRLKDHKDNNAFVKGTTKDNSGNLVTDGEMIPVQRLGNSQLFVGSFVLFPDGYPDQKTVPGRLTPGPLIRVKVGGGDISIESE